MSIQMVLNIQDWLIVNKNPKEIEDKVNSGLMIQEYIDGDISLGEIAEHTGKTIEETMKWLSHSGFSSSNIISQEALNITENNRLLKMEQLGLS